jgi:hypothetical protein
MSASETGDTPARRPQLYMALPTNGADAAATATFDDCLAKLAQMVGADMRTPDGTCAWRSAARIAIRAGLQKRDRLYDAFFDALVNAGVYDPNPSANAQFIRPAIAHFGRERVQTALLGFLRGGTNPERAGAARAWYWTHATERYIDHNRAEWDGLAGLRSAWREAALREFVANEDINVRRCILPGLPLSTEPYPADLHALVAEAIRIARTHSDEYLRHRVEIQIRT